MNKAEALKVFEEKDLLPLFQEVVDELEVLLQSEKDTFRKQFVLCISEACRKQQEVHPEMVNKILMLQLLRTDLAECQYKYRMVFYDKEWYLGQSYVWGMVDTGVIFRCYAELEARLKRRAARYMGVISRSYVPNYIWKLVPLFHAYVKELMLYAMSEATEDAYFQSLNKDAEFQIRIGELLEGGELLFQEQKDKHKAKILRWIAGREQGVYCFQDWRGLDFSGADFFSQDFRYSDFRTGNLEQTDLSLSLLNGCRMSRCSMGSCRLTGSQLHDADFYQADLRNADLSYSLSVTGKDPASNWKITGYVGGSFREADLSGASFYRAVICGIDFRGARLAGTDFTETSLYRSLFTRAQLNEAQFTAEQLLQINVTD